jgi:uncharacterized protein DUF5666
MMRTTFALLGATVLLMSLIVLPQRASADDETDQVEIKIVAPLEAVDCAAMPPTITVLGLSIDVSTANIESGDDAESDGEDGTPPAGSGCAALTVGSSVEVQLASDTAPLVATGVDANADDSEVSIAAPLQGVDATNHTITILGFTIDVTGVNLEGADDDAMSTQPIDVSQLMAGQFVEVKLASNQPPLTATDLEVKNFTNGVDVEVDDEEGEAVGDTEDDVDVDVEETVVVQNPAGSPRRVKKTVHFHIASNGHFQLSGMPTGRAKIIVTRATSTGHKGVSVKPNTLRSVRVRLRPAR